MCITYVGIVINVMDDAVYSCPSARCGYIELYCFADSGVTAWVLVGAVVLLGGVGEDLSMLTSSVEFEFESIFFRLTSKFTSFSGAPL